MRDGGLRLSLANLPLASARLERPAYDPRAVQIGVAHFGPGAFHRAHQASAFHQLLAEDPRWAVSAVSLRSPDLQAALDPQDGLFVLAQRDAETRLMVIASLRERLTAPRAYEAVVRRLTDPGLKLITSTVTEKGYCLTASGALDLERAEIIADLACPERPASLIGWIYLGMKRRRAVGLAPFLIAPCDNLSDNGGKLGRAVVDYARRLDPDLADWIGGESLFLSTMVDSITPATDDALRERVASESGLVDAWPVQREAFVQWVVEKSDAGQQPDWAAAGVQITTDVPAFERAKLRLLNGAHSMLAYLGLAMGLETVSQACGTPLLAAATGRLWEEVSPLLSAPAGLDLAVYRADLMNRFRNPVIVHRLSQIAWDGSQKVPVRLMASLVETVRRGQSAPVLALAIAGWMLFCVEAARRGRALTDPLAARLQAHGLAATGSARDVDDFLDDPTIFSDEARLPAVRDALRTAYVDLTRRGAAAAIVQALSSFH